jgi:hypothetical protein
MLLFDNIKAPAALTMAKVRRYLLRRNGEPQIRVEREVYHLKIL